MTDEVDNLVQKMDELAKQSNPHHAPYQQLQITTVFARLLVIVARKQAESAAKMERFTRWLIGLTIALILLTAYLCYDAYANHERIDFGHQSASQQR
jgi:hypothetical protein